MHGELHGIAEVNRNRNLAMPRLQRVTECKQVGHTRNDGGDRMDVHARNQCAGFLRAQPRIDPRLLRCR